MSHLALTSSAEVPWEVSNCTIGIFDRFAHVRGNEWVFPHTQLPHDNPEQTMRAFQAALGKARTKQVAGFTLPGLEPVVVLTIDAALRLVSTGTITVEMLENSVDDDHSLILGCEDVVVQIPDPRYAPPRPVAVGSQSSIRVISVAA